MSTVEEPHLVRRVLTAKEFGHCIGVSESTVHRIIAAREVQYIENPRGGRRIPVEEVEAYLRRNLRRERPAASPATGAGGMPPAAPGTTARPARAPAAAPAPGGGNPGHLAGPDGVRRLRLKG